MMNGEMMTGSMWAWVLFGVLIVAVIVPGIVLIMVWIMQKTIGGEIQKTGGSAIEILKARYAKGEISKEEFEEKKRDILS